MPPTSRPRAEPSQLKHSDGRQPQLLSDVVGVIATFLPATTYCQQPLMLVNHTWFRGIVEQDGMKPKPYINWPMVALRMRRSRLVLPENNDERCFTQLAEQYPDVEHITVPYTAPLHSSGAMQKLKTLKHLKLTPKATFARPIGEPCRRLLRQDAFVGSGKVLLPSVDGEVEDITTEAGANLNQYLDMLECDDPQKQLHATILIRKLCTSLSAEELPQMDQHLVDVVIAQLRREEFPALQFHSAWALANIATNTNTTLMLGESVRHLNQLLKSCKDENICEVAAWALSNIASRSRDCCVDMLQDGVVAALGNFFYYNWGPNRMLNANRTVMWALSNFCRHDPPPHISTIDDFVATFESALAGVEDDDVVMTMAAWGLCHISKGGNAYVEKILDVTCFKKLVELLMNDPSPDFATPAMKTIANCVSFSQMVISSDVSRMMARLLLHVSPSIRHKTSLALERIILAEEGNINPVIESGLVPLLLKALAEDPDENCRREAAVAIAHITHGSNDDAHTRILIEAGTLETMCKVLTLGEEESMCYTALTIIDTILERGEFDEVNPIPNIARFSGDDLKKAIAALADRPTFEQVHELGEVILDAYFI